MVGHQRLSAATSCQMADFRPDLGNCGELYELRAFHFAQQRGGVTGRAAP